MEKKLIKSVILFCAIMYSTTFLFAQTLSTYEQKRFDLADKTAAELFMEVPELGVMMGISVKKSDFADKYEEMYFFETLIESVGMSAVLAGSVDYQNYKVKEIYKAWTDKRHELDKTKTEADEQRELAHKKKDGSALPPDGTKARLLHSIKKVFERWAKKGEFEKTSELMIRYRDYGINVFDSICMLYTCGEKSIAKATDIDIKYDADEEAYTMNFVYGDRNNPKTIIGKGAVPISFAKKNQVENLGITAVRIVDGLIIPKEIQITFGNNETKELFTSIFLFDSIPGEKELTLCFSEIRFDGSVPAELLSHCINPNVFYKKDKIERENYINNTIDSIVTGYVKAKEHYQRLVNSYDNMTQTLKRLPYYSSFYDRFADFDDKLDDVCKTYSLYKWIDVHPYAISGLNPPEIEKKLRKDGNEIDFHKKRMSKMNAILNRMDTVKLNLCQERANRIFSEYIYHVQRPVERMYVESVSFDGNISIFKVIHEKIGLFGGKSKENFQGDFNADNKIFLVSFEGHDYYYTGNDIITTSSGDMYLRKRNRYIDLVKDNLSYPMQIETIKAIQDHGLFK